MRILRILKLIGLTLAGLFFLWFGIELLRSVYKLTNPFEFILSFFAASLVILISAALTFGFSLHLWRECRKVCSQGKGSDREGPGDNAK